jgi:HEAT repeat protein
MTFFCPACWSEIGPSDSSCPKCGADLRKIDAQSFAEKLRAALRHPVPQTAVRAAWILGERGDTSAVPDLICVLESARDSFLAEAAAAALGEIGDPAALPALLRASNVGAIRVRNASKQAIEQIHDKEAIQPALEEES